MHLNSVITETEMEEGVFPLFSCSRYGQRSGQKEMKLRKFLQTVSQAMGGALGGLKHKAEGVGNNSMYQARFIPDGIRSAISETTEN